MGMTPLCALSIPSPAARLRAVALAPERWWSPDASLQDGVLRAEGQVFRVQGRRFGPSSPAVKASTPRCAASMAGWRSGPSWALKTPPSTAWPGRPLLDGLAFAAALDAPPRLGADHRRGRALLQRRLDQAHRPPGPAWGAGSPARPDPAPAPWPRGCGPQRHNGQRIEPPRAFTLDLDAFGWRPAAGGPLARRHDDRPRARPDEREAR
jgi:hypothetical protein